jgi:spore germination cell wall hydrolase CwlJ-like protein
LDFITGAQKRAPLFLQKLNLEWAHRLASNPRRLWRRYLVEGVRIFPIYAKWRTRNLTGRGLVTVAVVIVGVGLVLLGVWLWARAGTTAGSITEPVPEPAGIAQIQLPPPNLLKPLTPQQAAEQNAERPFVGRPDSPAAKFILHTDAADRERALNCLAQAVYYEAASEGADGGRAVAQVVLNRMRHPGYPASVCGVVYQGADRPSGCQFTFTCDGSLLRTPVAGLWAKSRKIAQEALSGRVFAAVGHATHYHADYVLPYWADSLDKSVEIGRHIFYRLRSSLGDSNAFSQRYAGVEPDPPQPAQPGATVVIPSAAVTDQLANALIGDEVNNGPKQVEKVSAQPSSPLLIDASPSSLVADSGVPKGSAPNAKSARDCPATIDDKRVSPLRPNDVRLLAAPSPAC